MLQSTDKKPYQEQYERVKRLYTRINPSTQDHGDQKSYEDDLLSFFQAAWHLKDFIKNDKSLVAFDIECVVKNYNVLMVCADIAIGSKHLQNINERVGAKHSKTDVRITVPPLELSSLESDTIPILNCISHYSYYFKDDNGNEYNAIRLGSEIITAWNEIIARHITTEEGRLSFKERAKRYQIKFREQVLKTGAGEFDTYLCDDAALRGQIFYDGFGIFEVAKSRYAIESVQNKACYANILRSEHIPFNFFVPLMKNYGYAADVLNRFVGDIIAEITDIKIEHAPDPAHALGDKTSFDVFVEYLHRTGSQGILGIEVKYTEREYRLREGSTEEKRILNPNSSYYKVTDKIGLYKKGVIEKLKSDHYRQVWRNHLLGESMTRRNHPDSIYDFFTSIILYPEDNNHFRTLIPAYKTFLNPGREDSFTGITYESFIEVARGLTKDDQYLRWLQYLEDRYIVE